MHRQHVSRRIVFSAVVLGLAVLGLAPVHGTLAAPIGEGSKKTFAEGCKAMNGTFIDSPKDGLTACFYDDGSKHVCDTNGSQCTYYPPPPKKMEETSWADPLAGAASETTMIDDTQTVAPVDAPLEAIAEAPVEAIAETESAAPVDVQAAAAADTGALAAPAEAPVTLTEEPMITAGSTEQP